MSTIAKLARQVQQEAGERSGLDLREIPLALIDADTEQPRKAFAAQPLAELADSIKAHGLIYPLLVAPLDKRRFRLIDGERRWRALRKINAGRADCLVIRSAADGAKFLQLISNTHRADLTVMETARLLGGLKQTAAQIAKKMGWSAPKATWYLTVARADGVVADLVSAGVIAGIGSAYKAALIADSPAGKQWLARMLAAGRPVPRQELERVRKETEAKTIRSRPRAGRPRAAAAARIAANDHPALTLQFGAKQILVGAGEMKNLKVLLDGKERRIAEIKLA